MKIKKIILIFTIVLGTLLFISTISNAATASITDNKTVTVGTSVTVTGSVNAGSWNLTLTGDGQSKKLVGNFDLENPGNTSASTSISFTPNSAGTYTFTLSGDITDYDTEQKSQINKTCTITVKEKDANTGSTGNNTNNNTSSTTANTQTEPTFTATNQTVYATGDINVRSSYSTSSQAVGSLKKGDSVTRTGIGSNGWSKVTYNGTTAYISSSLLTTTKPEEEEKSTNKALKSLSIEQAELDPEFNKDTTNYSITVGGDVDSLKIDAVPEDEKAQVTISGNENLQIGTNTVKILVKAEDGTIRTYTIIVTKEEKEQLKLLTLEINGISLNEKFNPDTYEYTANLDEKSNITNLNIKATANDEDAIIEVIGSENLAIGENVVTIMVKSKDGKENVTYQILVNKTENANTEAISNTEEQEKNNKMFLFWAIGIFAIALILIILVIVKSKKKSKEEKEFGFDYNNENIAEELYSIRKEDEIKEEVKEVNNMQYTEENYADTMSHTKLYDVEKEVDFSEDERRTRRKGKHSK